MTSVAFTLDGALLASTSIDHTPLSGQSGSLTGAIWSNDRALASSSDDGTDFLWSMQWRFTGDARLGHPLTRHKGPVDGVAFGGASGGRYVLGAAGNDAAVVVGDAADHATWIANACAIATRDFENLEGQLIERGRAQRRSCP